MTTVKGFGLQLDILIKDEGLTRNSFAKRIGLESNAQIVRICNDLTLTPSYKLILSILNAFPNVNGHWLLTGEGPKRLEEGSRRKTFTRYFRINPGDDFFPDYDDENAACTDHLYVYGYHDCDLAIDVYGDSMSPKYRPGDIVMAKKCSFDEPIIFGEAYLIKVLRVPKIRYIKSEPDTDTLKLGAETATIEDYTIKKSDVKSFYIIKGIIRRDVL